MRSVKQSDRDILILFKNILDKYPGISQNNYDRLRIHSKIRPSRRTIKRIFGSWKQAVELIDTLEPNEAAQQQNPSEEIQEPEIPLQDTEQYTQEYTDDTGILVSKSLRITSLDEAIAYFKVDTNIWEVDKFIINKWEVGAKNKSLEIKTTELYQVKVWLKRKITNIVEVALNTILTNIHDNAPEYPVINNIICDNDRYMYEICIFDLHLANLSWAQETGADYDTKIAEERYMHAITNLMGRTQGLNIERITLPTGSDLLHVDNIANTTTAGTRQDVDSRWQRAFQHAIVMLVNTIESLALIAPVDVPIIPGNHDYERMFYIGEALRQRFHKSDRIIINNSPDPRKYIHYGCNLIGYTHGKDEKPDSLPLIMARERPKLWAETIHHEWHIGHLHKQKETKYIAGDTFCGVPVRIIPSLCEANAWHHSMGYVKGIRAAEAYLWSYDNGYIGHFSSNIIGEKNEN